MIESYKGHRSFIHQKGTLSFKIILLSYVFSVSEVFSKSTILNKNVGDTTLILNNPALTNNNYLFNRVITSIIQFVTVSPYPPKTASLNRIFKDVSDEYSRYQNQQKSIGNNYKLFSNNEALFEKKPVKRIDLVQHTLAGASVYALSKNDTARRLSNFQNRSGKALIAGPALLIQREFPSKKDFKTLNEITHDFGDGNVYFWDNRIFLQIKVSPDSDGSKSPLVFKIMPLCPNLVKEFENITKSDFSARKNLYSYLGMTPGSHLHTVPVLLHVHSGYMAIPTLNCYSNRNIFEWNFFNASIGVHASKFLCLP